MITPEQLVQLIREANVRNQPHLARLYKHQLWTICQGRIIDLVNQFTRNHPDRREDYFQTAYLELEAAVAQYDLNRLTPFAGYFHLRTRSEFLDLARRRVTQTRPDFSEQEHSYTTDLAANLCRQELRERIQKLLEGLLPNDRDRNRKIEAFELRYFENWPVESIREKLGVRKAATVSQWIHRVKSALGKALLE